MGSTKCILFYIRASRNGLDKDPVDPAALGLPNVQNIKICCGSFRTGFHPSLTRLYFGPLTITSTIDKACARDRLSTISLSVERSRRKAWRKGSEWTSLFNSLHLSLFMNTILEQLHPPSISKPIPVYLCTVFHTRCAVLQDVVIWLY